MSWDDFQQRLGAELAEDGIPLHYSDLKAEYHAALENAVLMDRSHEGRFEVRGKSRLDLIQRISTNDLLSLQTNEGRPTIFTSPIGRILDRVAVYNQGDTAFMTTEPGRTNAVRTYLQKQIFFNDEFKLEDLASRTRLFTLHGPSVHNILNVPASQDGIWQRLSTSIAGHEVLLLERKPLSGEQWAIIVPLEAAETVWTSLLETGKPLGLLPAGSLTYNTIRIGSGRPAAGRELTSDYIPLEAGLWDEVSFNKGCYTGQEIIARMESRNRLARVMVKLSLSAMIDAPVNLYHDGKVIGTLTSSVTTPDGDNLGIGYVKTAVAEAGEMLTAGENQIRVSIMEIAGVQPPREVAQ